MKLYLECNMGASGNMLMASLYELLPDKTAFHKAMERLRLPGVVIEYSASSKCGITGTHISVKIDGIEENSDDVKDHNHHSHDHQHNHSHHNDHDHHDRSHYHHGRRYGYNEILDLIRNLDLPAKVKDDAVGVYKILGEAEAKVHGISLDEIHFHEIGSIDAVADVVGCSLLMDMLGVSDVLVSSVHVGFGMVRCEHGILPVPAPATSEILRGIPIYNGKIEGELCTPTGAALLKYFATSFGPMPQIIVIKIGCGMGTKDFEAANCLRAFLYDEAAPVKNIFNTDNKDIVCEISCNLDDMTSEAIGAAFEILIENGALDVFTTPVMMKKNRPAVMLSCLCNEESCDSLMELMLKHTTTLGVRVTKCHRIIMERTIENVQTEYGDIRVKRAERFGISKYKPEYDDVMNAARKHSVPFQVVYDAAYNAARQWV